MKIVRKILRACFVVLLLAESGVVYLTGHVAAQETMKQKKKVCVRCWVSCCPFKVGCEAYPCDSNSSAARKAGSGAEVKVSGGQMTAEFKPTNDQNTFEVKQETKLDAQTADALGFKEITMLPGQYPVTKLGNGKAKVSIKVRTAGAKSDLREDLDGKPGKGKSKN